MNTSESPAYDEVACGRWSLIGDGFAWNQDFLMRWRAAGGPCSPLSRGTLEPVLMVGHIRALLPPSLYFKLYDNSIVYHSVANLMIQFSSEI